MNYLQADLDILHEKNIEFKYLGYYKRVPQEAYYYVQYRLEANPAEQKALIQKYNSLDDKTDGFFYYTRWIKFGVGRAMMTRLKKSENHHITREEGIALMERYEGEYPERYEADFLDYIGMTRDESMATCDRFRSPHLWKVERMGNGNSERHPVRSSICLKILAVVGMFKNWLRI